MNQDPIGFAAGNVSFCRYVGNDDKLDSKGKNAYSDLLKLKDETEAAYPEQFSRGEKPDHPYPSRDKWEDEMREKRKLPPRASSKAARGTSTSKTTVRVKVGKAASAVGDTLDGMKGVVAKCNVGVTVASEALGVIEAAKDVGENNVPRYHIFYFWHKHATEDPVWLFPGTLNPNNPTNHGIRH